jgi:uncharacterized membrane protein
MTKPFFDWHTRYTIRHFLRTSFCMVPVLAIVAALITAPIIRYIDDFTRWRLIDISPDAARAAIGTLPSALLTLIVFSLSILLLAVQMVGSQFSPRVIARFFEDRILKWVLGIFVFAHSYSLFALGRIEERVPVLPIMFALFLNLICLAVFLYLIQYVGRGFRAIKILTGIATDTKQVIMTLFPRPYCPEEGEECDKKSDMDAPDRVIRNQKKAGVFIAFNQEGLVELAVQHDCVIELASAVGEFVAEDQALLRIYGAGGVNIDEKRIMRCVIIDLERTLEQDPDFGFRMIVDIAAKALSPAINDPTTGVLAIDQLQHLLELLGNRQLDTGLAKDATRVVRLVFPFCGWEDFVVLAATEMRHYGGPNPQITRRLQAMYEYLLQVLPASRKDAIYREMALLQQTVNQTYGNAQDRKIASTADMQGFGAHYHQKGM